MIYLFFGLKPFLRNILLAVDSVNSWDWNVGRKHLEHSRIEPSFSLRVMCWCVWCFVFEMLKRPVSCHGVLMRGQWKCFFNLETTVLVFQFQASMDGWIRTLVHRTPENRKAPPVRGFSPWRQGWAWQAQLTGWKGKTPDFWISPNPWTTSCQIC